MTHTSKPIRVSRLLPGLDFGLLLIVLTCGTAGLQWLTTSSEATTAEQALLPASSEDVANQLHAVEQEFERLRRELDRKRAEAARLRNELEQAEAESPDLDSTQVRRGLAERDLEKLRQDVERLDKELQQFQQQEQDLQQKKARLEKLREDVAGVNKNLADLRSELERLNRGNESLPQEIARLEKLPLNRSSVVVNFTPEFKPEETRRAVGVALTEGTVAPVREPYYTFFQAGMKTLKLRLRKGDTAAEALAAGSDFSKLLNQIDPRNEYIYLYVDSSSFGTFSTIREELEKREIPWGWEPWEDLEKIVGSSEGVRRGTTQ